MKYYTTSQLMELGTPLLCSQTPPQTQWMQRSKVRFSRRTVLNAYRRVVVWLHSFVNSGLKWVCSFTLWPEFTQGRGAHWIKDWVNPRVGLDVSGNRRLLLLSVTEGRFCFRTRNLIITLNYQSYFGPPSNDSSLKSRNSVCSVKAGNGFFKKL
jgi:hypothetical protein